MTESGLLVRAYGGFFDVDSGNGCIRCRARGRLHLDGVEPIPGDYVNWIPDPDHPGFGILTGIHSRKNSLVRPSIANLDFLVFVASASRPVTDPFLIDRMSVIAHRIGCGFLLCLNKTDLASASDLSKIYESCRIQVIETSAVTGTGIEMLRDVLKGSVSAMTGNSGVGKSSLINLLIPGALRETAPVSLKHGRGKHTTRHAELLALPSGGWIADTPGFAALDVSQFSLISAEELASCFPEFPSGKCRFPDCMHRKEPDCAVKASVDEGAIPRSRYQSYLRLLSDAEAHQEY